MKIPENTLKEIKDKLSEYDKPCPMCGGTTWNIYPIYQFIGDYGDTVITGTSVINVTCEGCGFCCHYAPAKLLGYRPKELKYAD